MSGAPVAQSVVVASNSLLKRLTRLSALPAKDGGPPRVECPRRGGKLSYAAPFMRILKR